MLLHHLWPTCRWYNLARWWIQPELQRIINPISGFMQQWVCDWPCRVRSSPTCWLWKAAEDCRRPWHRCLRSSLPLVGAAPKVSHTSSSAGHTGTKIHKKIQSQRIKCFNNAPWWPEYIRNSSRNKSVSHLQCKDTDHRFVITDTVLHVTGVEVLSDLQRVLLILLHLFDLPYISINPLFLLCILRGVFGSEPPQNPVGPGRFPFLRADTKVKGNIEREREQRCFSQQTKHIKISLLQAYIKHYQANYDKYSIY